MKAQHVRGTQRQLWNTHHDLPELVRLKVIEVLDLELASYLDLELRARTAAWNVKGPSVEMLRNVFGKCAETFAALGNAIGKRISMLGGVVEGTARAVVERSPLPEYDESQLEGSELIWVMSGTLTMIAQRVRSSIEVVAKAGDAASARLLSEVSLKVDEEMWRMECHIALDSNISR